MRQAEPAYRAFEGLRIAVLADPKPDIILISDALEDLGAEVYPVRRAHPRWSEDEYYDLLLVDMRGSSLGQKGRGAPPVDRIGQSQRVVALVDQAVNIRGVLDFILSPVRIEEVVARLRRVLSEPRPEPTLHAGNLSMDVSSRMVTVGDRQVDITMNEFEILRGLLVAEGVVLSRDILAHKAGQPKATGRSIDIHIHRLRAKLDGILGAEIETVRGVGYRLRRQ